jgi:large repetitive protein
MPARHARTRRSPFDLRTPGARVLASITALALLTAGFVLGLPVAPASAAYPITLEVGGDSGVLAGDRAAVELTASNDGTVDLFNLSYRYVLPPGVTYVGGSTAPVTAGEPKVIPVYDAATEPDTLLRTVLIWANASDLPRDDEQSISFALAADPTIYPVGSVIAPQEAGIYADSSPRRVPAFGATGDPLATSYDASDAEAPQPTSVSAIRITKSEPSPEGELMRGVHEHSTTYTLTVRNTNQGASDDVVVVDYLPAGLEFLACGQVDHTAAGAVEYDGAPRLTVVPAPDGAAGDCRTPASVTTVTDPEPGLSGVFTRLEWQLGSMLPGAEAKITHRAGIPLRSNTATWPGGTPAADGSQAANLDNNTGASTRQIQDTSGFTNRAVVTARYLGAVQNESFRDQRTSASRTVQASDVSIVKTASTTTFSSGQTVTFSLAIRAGEYADLGDLVIVDTIPDGLCPLVSTDASLPAECRVAQPVSGATVDGVVANPDGTFTVTMTPGAGSIAADGTATVTYAALMRATYIGNGGDPTVSGDSFTNQVVISGTSTDVTGSQSPATQAVRDDSRATLGSTPPSIAKKVLPRPADVGAVDCAAYAGQYSDTVVPKYRLGDSVCFELSVAFSDSTVTRNAVIQDFVPVGSTFVDYAVAASSTVPASQVQVSTAGGNADSPIFTLGAASGVAGDSGLYVAKGADLVLYVRALVVSAPVDAAVDITANLMKYRQESSDGTVLSLRDQAEYAIAPAAEMAIDKAITGGDPSTRVVRGGDQVDFSITVRNSGTAFDGNDFPVQDAVVWDALPAGFACSTVTNITGAGVCTDPGASGHPVFVGSTSRSAIVWTVAGPLAAAASATIGYRVAVPNGFAIAQSFRNDASIVRFASPNTAGGLTSYYPAESLDASHTANTVAANDFATLTTPNATVAKTATPNLTIPGKGAAQVVAGETLAYTYSVTVPRGTAVFDGVLADTLPGGLTIASGATITGTLNGGALPNGFAVDDAGKLTFPATYSNVSGADAVFAVTIDRVLVGVGLSSGALTNTARFTSNAAPAGAAVTTAPATATVTVVAPNPTITKSANPTSNVVIGQTVTYTLSLGNTSGRPTAYNPVVTDCLPGGLDFVAFGSAPSGTVTSDVPGDGTNGCASGTRKLTWQLQNSVLTAGAAALQLTFTATVGSTAGGLAQIANTATLVSSTLDNGVNDAAVELVISRTSSAANVTVIGASTTKTLVAPTGANPQATIGDTLRYRVSVTLPANVNFYKAFVQDTLPGSGSTPSVTTSNVVVSCVAGAGASDPNCAADLPAAGSTVAASGRSTGWLLGDVTSRPWVRTVTVEYDATVADVAANVRDFDLINTARLNWRENSSGAGPTNAASNLDKQGTTGTATTVNVRLPQLSIAKSASDTTIEPGQVYTYRVDVANATSAFGSTAYNATVVDTIPAGVVVDPASLTASGGVLATNAGVTTITWTLPAIANGGTWTATYQASLAASSTLSTAALVNSARIPNYRTLDGAGRLITGPAAATATVTPQFPSVTLGKAAASGTLAYAGAPFSWTLTLTNGGSGTAASVTPTDTLPANWTYNGDATLSIAGGPAVAFAPSSVSGQSIQWPSLGQLAPGQVATIRYTATPTTAALTTPGSGSTVQHVNTVSAVTADATGATSRSTPPTSYTGAAASASAHIDRADVAIVKANDAAVIAGTETPSAWRLTVSNAGPDTALGPFQVSDAPTSPLPEGVRVVSAQGTGWQCTVPDTVTGVFDCVRTNANDTLASGASFPAITVTVRVDATVANSTTVANVATVSARTYDANTANNTSSVQTQVVATRADLAVVKTNAGGIAAGGQATWSIAVSNAGPSLARYPITVTDTLPAAGLDLDTVVASGSGWTCDAVEDGEFTCTYAGTPGGGLAVGSLPAITVTAAVLSSATGTLANRADVASPTEDPNPTNNTSTASTAVNTDTTLTLSKDLLTDPFVPGEQATYRLTVTNVGTADARDVSIADSLPEGLTFVSATGAGWTCDGTVTCTLPAGLPGKGGTSTIDLVVAVESGLTDDVVNTATVRWAPNRSVSDSDDSGVTGEADFSITKTQAAGPVLAGTEHEYTLTVANLGPSDSPAGAVVADTVPAGLAPTAVSVPAGWDCSISGQTVTCTSTDIIVAGAPADEITIDVAIPADGGPATYRNTATVVGPIDDPVSGNDSSSVDTVVTDQADVTIDKSGPATVTAGTAITWRLVVTNDGPSVADSVLVTDVLPAGFTNATFTAPDGWTCTAAGCSIPALPVGETEIAVTADVAPSLLPGTVHTNTGRVGWVDVDGPSTDEDTADVEIVAIADLTLDKTPGTQDAVAGTDVEFTLTVGNLGPSNAAAPITVVDTLPVGLRYASAGAGWTCTAGDVAATDPQPVTCVLDGSATIPAGGTALALEFRASSDPALPAGTVTNRATSSSPTDPTPASDTADVVFALSADLAITKSHQADAVLIGQQLDFALDVTNAGPSAATAVRVTDTLPEGIEFVDAGSSDAAWSCAATGQEVVCDLAGSLAPGMAPALVLTTTVSAEAYPSVINTAVVESAVADPDRDDNTAEDAVEVPPMVELTVEKTHVGDVRIGERATYVITVGNEGPTEEPGDFSVVDTLPGGLRFVSSSGTAVECATDGQVVTCDFDDPLPVGGEREVALVVDVLPDAPAELVNTVEVLSPWELTTLPIEAEDEATVLPAHPLAFTGVGGMATWWALLAAVNALVLGLGALLWRRRRTV